MNKKKEYHQTNKLKRIYSVLYKQQHDVAMTSLFIVATIIFLFIVMLWFNNYFLLVPLVGLFFILLYLLYIYYELKDIIKK